MGALRYEAPSPLSSSPPSQGVVESKLDSFSFISVLDLPLTVPLVGDFERILFRFLVGRRIVKYA